MHSLPDFSLPDFLWKVRMLPRSASQLKTTYSKNLQDPDLARILIFGLSSKGV